MDAEVSARVNKAVEDCLTQCSSAPQPNLEVTEYCTVLENELGWAPQDVDAVRRAVQRGLSQKTRDAKW